MKRELPRFEVVAVTRGTRKGYLAFDHMTKQAHYPMDVHSQAQAFLLVEMLAMEARKRGEPLSVLRSDHPSVQQKPSPAKQG